MCKKITRKKVANPDNNNWNFLRILAVGKIPG